jgi:hypothetical protein
MWDKMFPVRGFCSLQIASVFVCGRLNKETIACASPWKIEMAWISSTCVKIIICTAAAVFSASAVSAARVILPGQTAKAGQLIRIPVMIDQVDNLAGIKLVMKYDAALLNFMEAVKTKRASSLMHIVNNKKPGLLIVVMAGARGIKGTDFSILSMRFTAKNGLKRNHTTRIEITEVQLMSDKLKNVKCDVLVEPITILPESN